MLNDYFNTYQPDLLNLSARKGICFFALRSPGGGIRAGASLSVGEGLVPNSFLFSPFLNAGKRPRSILPQLSLADIALLPESDIYKYKGVAAIESTDFAQYASGVSAIIDYHRQHGGKTVYSRIISDKCSELNLDGLFSHLRELYPGSTIFCFGSPESGIWIGATPELLLRKTDSGLETMSLAGTREAGASGDWDAKNREEQQLVTDFIVRVLEESGFEVNHSALNPITRNAGPVEHLCTPIMAVAPAIANTVCLNETNIEALLQKLSPTPALCGSDRAASLRLISTYESHDRGCYGGYFGIVDGDGSFDLYVNLRSMRIYSDGCYTIYVGGGITSLSDFKAEWAETSRKSEVMLRALGRL